MISIQKRIHLGPLIISLSQKGIGLSVGTKGVRIRSHSSGSKNLSVRNIGGTGLSYSKTISKKRKRKLPKDVNNEASSNID